MIDSGKLIELIDSKGIKKEHIAEVLGITEKTLYNKINNLTQFTGREIGIMCEILDIKNFKVVNSIFFAPDVD